MKQDLLKNKVYLALLAKYSNKEMPSYVKLSDDAKVSRQTVSVKVKELIDEGIIRIDEDDYVIVSNLFDIDTGKLKAALESGKINIDELVGSQDRRAIVYGIQSEGIVKYIGITYDYDEEIKRHIVKKPFLSYQSFFIFTSGDWSASKEIQEELEGLLLPEWNFAEER